jgi:PAS domain S-box-containing protein
LNIEIEQNMTETLSPGISRRRVKTLGKAVKVAVVYCIVAGVLMTGSDWWLNKASADPDRRLQVDIIKDLLFAFMTAGVAVWGLKRLLRDWAETARLGERRFAKLFESSPMAMVLSTAEEGRCLDASEEYLKLVEYSREEIIGRTGLELGIWAQPEQRAAIVEKIKEMGAVHSLELQIRTRSGELKHLLWTEALTVVDGESCLLGSAVERTESQRQQEDPGSRVVALFGTRDSIERKQAETALQLSDFSMNHSLLPTFWVTSDARVIRVNQAACAQLGYTEAELLQLSVPDFDPNLSLARWPEHWQALRATKQMKFETSQRRKDGRLVPVEMTLHWFEFGGREYNFAFARDITEIRQAEAALRENEAKFRAIFSSSALATAIVERDTTISLVNDAYCRASGYTRDEVVGKSWHWTVLPEDLERMLEYSHRRLRDPKDAPEEYEFRFLHKNGEVRHSQIRVALIPSTGQIIASMLDITGRKRQEQQLTRLNDCFLELGVDAEANIKRLVALCGELCQPTCALYNRLQDAHLCSLGWKTPPDFPAQDVAEGHICTDVIRQNSGTPVILRDLSQSPYAHTDPNILRYGLKTYIGVAVRSQDQAVGSLCLVYQHDLKPDEGILELLHIIATAVGIEESRKQARENLRASEEHYRSLFENMNEGFAFCQMIFENGQPQDFVYLAVNKMFTTLTGLKDVTGKRATEVMPGLRESDPEFFEIYGQVATTGQTKKFNRYLKALHKWFEVSVYSNQPGCFVAVFDGITERKLAEERLQATASQLLEAQHIARLGSYNFDMATGTWTGSEVLDELFGVTDPGYTRDVAGWLRVVHPGDRAEIQQYLQNKVLRDKVAFDRNYRVVRLNDQQTRWVHGLGKLVLDDRGQVTRMVGVIQDITESKRAEHQLNLQFSALSAAANAIVITDRHGKIEWINPSFTKLTGYTAEEALGNNSRLLSSGQHPRAFYANLWTTVLAGKVWHGELINKRKGGQLYTEETTITPVADVDGQITHFVAIKLDVTEKRQIESRLQQAQKMEAIGALAGGIAHDFNNILSAIFGYGHLLQQDTAGNTEAQQDVAEILTAADRAKELVRQILTFSRQRERKRDRIRLDAVIKEATKFMRASLPSSIEIKMNLAGETPDVIADPTQIYQVTMNLATNALHAMEGRSGQLSISLEPFQPDEQFIRLHPELKPIPYARLTVADTGHGMDAKTLERIFEPFFTTKPVGQGTGLGLSVVHGIVQSHEGAIAVYSEPGRGTTFRLYFPGQTNGEILAEHAGKNASQGRGQKILLLDDEPALTASLKRQLERLNYQVTVSNSAREVIKWLRDNAARFDLVITDLTMPEMSGLEVAHELHALRPDLPVILASGFTADLKLETLKSAGIFEVLEKPASLTVLADALQRALGQ